MENSQRLLHIHSAPPFTEETCKPALQLNISSTTLVSDTTSSTLVSDNQSLPGEFICDYHSDNIKLQVPDKTEPRMSDSVSVSVEADSPKIAEKVPLYQDVSQVTLEDNEDQVSGSVLLSDQPTDRPAPIQKSLDEDPGCASSLRHGISRYAPYGTRFAALMKDGSYKMSHIAGDLANRARSKSGKGGRADLVLVTHDGEREQLEAALAFYENATNKYVFGPRPGPSEVLSHLKELGIDWDYRKGENVKLLQRNASNFFKRMMEHARRLQHILAEPYSVPPAPPNATMIINSSTSLTSAAPALTPAPTPAAVEADVRKAAVILTSMMFAKPEAEEAAYPEEFSDEMDIELSDDYSNQSNSVFQRSFDTINSSQSSLPNKRHEIDNDRVTDWSRPKHLPGSFYFEVCRHTVQSLQEENEFYSKTAETFDWSLVEDVTSAYKPNRVFQRAPPKIKRSYQYGFESDSDFEEFRGAPQPRSGPKKQKIAVDRSYSQQPEKPFSTPVPRQRQAPKAFVSNGSVVSTAPQAVIRKGREGLSAGVFLKGLSRHSPYGTRFCATMPSGEKRESYLAGDLADRVRTGPGGGELLLVLHPGEIDQLQSAWEFVLSQVDVYNVGAGQVLEHLRLVGKDANHRKPGTVLLQKNAGNFFKRVQEYGKRKQCDPNYLSFTPRQTADLSTLESATTVAQTPLASSTSDVCSTLNSSTTLEEAPQTLTPVL